MQQVKKKENEDFSRKKSKAIILILTSHIFQVEELINQN